MSLSRNRLQRHSVRLSLIRACAIASVFAATPAVAAEPLPSQPEQPPATAQPPSPDLQQPSATATSPQPGYTLGAHAEIDAGLLAVMKQSAGLAGGVVWGPFRAGLSYATFLSNTSFGGVPDGFSLRVNYVVGINASYFIGQSTDDGLYVQAMFHIKQQGVTNDATGDHADLNSLLTGLELGYVWKVYKGLYVAPRVGALYYLKSPQGSDNDPIQIGDRAYDNDRHQVFDTYFIPTLSIGYSL